MIPSQLRFPFSLSPKRVLSSSKAASHSSSPASGENDDTPSLFARLAFFPCLIPDVVCQRKALAVLCSFFFFSPNFSVVRFDERRGKRGTIFHLE